VSLLADAQKQMARKSLLLSDEIFDAMGGDYETSIAAEPRFVLSMALVLGLMTVLLIRRVRAAAPDTVDPRRRAAGDAGRAYRPLSHLQYSQRRLGVGFSLCSAWTVLTEVINGGEPQRHARAGRAVVRGGAAGAGERLRPVLMTAAVARWDACRAALRQGLAARCSVSVATFVTGGLILATFSNVIHYPDILFIISGWWKQRAACEARRQAAAVSG